MKRCIIRCHVVEDFWSYRAVFGPSTYFCNWNFRTPAWVNNVIGLHESCLGQLPWDQFTGRVPFTEGFLSLGYQLGFSVSDYFCLRHKSTQVCRMTGKHPSAAAGRISFLVTSQASGQGFVVDSRDPSTKQINGHRDLGATKLPDI
jgi:hypothetical protein